MQLNARALGLTAGILAGLCWFAGMTLSLLTGIGGRTITTLGSYHLFFSYSWLGMVIMVVEHLIGGFIAGYIFAWLYNKLAAPKLPQQ